MSGSRIKIARDALILFIRSLPEGCDFSVISFGTNFASLDDNRPFMTYDNESKTSAINAIEKFTADFGGTKILEPLQAAQTSAAYDSGKKKRIFCLTDGQVSNSSQVIQAAREHRDQTRVYTFGLGSGCDKNLVTQVATAGRGSHTLVDDRAADLNAQVIRALTEAMQPSLKDA